ncbi:MAG: hypothetical protein EOO48_00590 [Flavobacterium sp.]|nr:MAG: hypothetical protein EOO48_00590 [Flavobacterium sp.]
MDTDKILELAFYTLPALITGAVAFNFFQMFMRNESKKRQFALARENQKQSLPLRLQAYERMALLMERIDPAKLLIRITPISEDKTDYANFVIAQVEQEFEHNLTQQIYMSDECWGIITTAKNATIQMLRKTAVNNEIADADKLREAVLKEMFDKPSPSTAALAYIKQEVKEFL